MRYIVLYLEIILSLCLREGIFPNYGHSMAVAEHEYTEKASTELFQILKIQSVTHYSDLPLFDCC